MTGTFDADWLGFMVYDDDDRLPLGKPDRCELRATTFNVYWPSKSVHRDGNGIAIAIVLPDGSVSLTAIDPVAVERGFLFWGSLSFHLPNTLEWHDDRLKGIGSG